MNRTVQAGGAALALALLALSQPALAQDRDHGGPDRQSGEHGDRGGDRGGREGQGQPRGDQPRGPQPRIEQQPVARPAQVATPGQQRPLGEGGRPNGYAGDGVRQNWDARRANADARQNGYRGRPDGDRGPGGYRGPDQARGGAPGQPYGDRYRNDQNQRGGYGQYRGNDDRGRRGDGGYDQGRYGNGSRQAYGRGGPDWNRDWHRDNRYDWNGYRAHNRDAFRLGGYYAPYHGYSYRRIGIGFSLQPLFFGSSYWIGDPYEYRLPPAYGPYRWVRYYDDALLVNIYSGEVVDTVYDIFW